MLRTSLLLAALVAALLGPANGCQSCSSCHDYDSPVKDCQCAYMPQSGCSGGGCSSGGCSECNSGMTESGYHMQPAETSQPSAAEVEGAMPPASAMRMPEGHWGN